MSQKKSYQSSFISVTILFFLWGFITVLVDSLVPRLKEVFEMSYAKTVLVQFAFFTAFFVISLPAGAILTKIGVFLAGQQWRHPDPPECKIIYRLLRHRHHRRHPAGSARRP